MHEILHHIFHRRHFWRHVKMSELSELYISLMLRALGLSLIGIFVPIYFYLSGISLGTIALFFAFMYSTRFFIDPISGMLVSRYGPKHVMRASYFIEIGYLLAIIGAGNGYVPLWLAAISFSMTMSLFFVAFNVDFSSVKSSKAMGSQYSFVAIVRQIAGVLGPLAGGLIATYYNFETAVTVAIFITLLAGVPLMLTGEAKSRNAYRFKHSISNYTVGEQDRLAFIGFASNLLVNNMLWPLFTGIVIFTANEYSGIGLVKAIGLSAGVLTAHAIGKIVDNKKGRALLRWATVTSTLGHLVRPFVSSVSGALAFSLVTEPLYTAMDIPFTKGWYDRADSSKIGRVAHIISGLATLHATRMVGWLTLFFASMHMSDQVALGFVMATFGMLTLLLLGERFKALD